MGVGVLVKVCHILTCVAIKHSVMSQKKKKSGICWADQEQDIWADGVECGQGIYKMFDKLVATTVKLH